MPARRQHQLLDAGSASVADQAVINIPFLETRQIERLSVRAEEIKIAPNPDDGLPGVGPCDPAGNRALRLIQLVVVTTAHAAPPSLERLLRLSAHQQSRRNGLVEALPGIRLNLQHRQPVGDVPVAGGPEGSVLAAGAVAGERERDRPAAALAQLLDQTGRRERHGRVVRESARYLPATQVRASVNPQPARFAGVLPGGRG